MVLVSGVIVDYMETLDDFEERQMCSRIDPSYPSIHLVSAFLHQDTGRASLYPHNHLLCTTALLPSPQQHPACDKRAKQTHRPPL